MLSKLKKRLRRAERKERRLARSIDRLQRNRAWARKVGLTFVARMLDSVIDRTQRRREEIHGKIELLEAAITANQLEVPDVVDGGWHPNAMRTQIMGPLAWATGYDGMRLPWHTTEGYGLPLYGNTQPHFTINPATGELWQHVPIIGGAYALANASGGVETNRARAIQVEIIGFARDAATWPPSFYAELAELARWIEKHAGVPRSCGVTFAVPAKRMSAEKWRTYAGHCGHQHIPENDHWDPGALRIAEVLDRQGTK